MSVRRALLPLALALSVGLLLVFFSGRTMAVPDDFRDQFLNSVEAPTALAFTPDRRLLVTTKPGELRVREDGQLLQAPALDIGGKVCSNSERGLLGVAVDPAFATNRYVYLYYTYDKHNACPTEQPGNANNPVNRVSRFVLSDSSKVDPASERVLINNVPSPNGNHNGGDLHFGKDGYLYASVGDGGADYKGDSGKGGANDAARDRNVLLGKILRVTRSGEVPATNPFTGSNSRRCNVAGRTAEGFVCKETFASGLRNPFRMAFDPDAAGTRFFINDVGQGAWEEIDAGKAGADYGWNLCEGRHDNPNRPGLASCAAASPYALPVHEYNHNTTGCSSITGGAFVPRRAEWPASYEDAYLFGDFVCNKIFKLTPKQGGGFTKTTFANSLEQGGSIAQGGPIAMTFGPRSLHYTTFDGGGQVRRIVYTGSGTTSP